MPPSEKPIRPNRAIGRQANIGPLHPSLLIPFCVAAVIAYISYSVFHLRMIYAGLVMAWLFASWWITTGGDNWRFMRRFGGWIQRYWMRGSLPYSSPLRHDQRKNRKRRL